MGHHVRDKEFDGPHRLLVAQLAPLEGTDEVIGAGRHILIHIRADRVRGPGHDAEASPDTLPADPTRIGATLLLRRGPLCQAIARWIRFPGGPPRRTPLHL